MRQQNNFPHAHMQPSPMDIWSSRVVDMMCVAAKASVAESQKPETAAELHFALRLKWLSKPHFSWAFASWPIWCERVVCTVVSDWFATDWLGLTLSDHQERRGRVDLQKMPWSCPKILEAWLCRSSTSYSTNATSHCKELQGHFEPEGLAPAPHSLHFGTFDRFWFSFFQPRSFMVFVKLTAFGAAP